MNYDPCVFLVFFLEEGVLPVLRASGFPCYSHASDQPQAGEKRGTHDARFDSKNVPENGVE